MHDKEEQRYGNTVSLFFFILMLSNQSTKDFRVDPLTFFYFLISVPFFSV